MGWRVDATFLVVLRCTPAGRFSGCASRESVNASAWIGLEPASTGTAVSCGKGEAVDIIGGFTSCSYPT
jgi:hypothetical protein